MNVDSICRTVVAIWCFAILAEVPLRAQDPPAAGTAEIKGPELQKLDEQYKAEVAKADEVKKAAKLRLDAAYTAAVDAALKKATAAGQLDDAVALQQEAKVFAADPSVPESDEAETRPELMKLRGAYRAEVARQETQRSASVRTATDAHLARLRQLEKELTKAAKIDDALEVRRQIVLLASPSGPAIPPPTAPPTSPVAVITPAPSATPVKSPIKPTLMQEAADAAKNPVGTWIFKVKGGPSYRRTFHEDGTITGDGFAGAGHWHSKGNRIIITYPGRGDGFMSLPLKPSGTKGAGHDGQEQVMTKVN